MIARVAAAVSLSLLPVACEKPDTSTPKASASALAEATAALRVSASAPAPPSATTATLETAANASAAAPSLPTTQPLPVIVRSSSPLAPRPPATATSDAGAAVGDGGVTTADAGAAPSAGQQVASQVDAIFAGKKTFRAEFDQFYTQKVTGSVKTSTGVVFVERPDKISFRYNPPSDNRIVADGATIKAYVADDKQMFVSPAQKSQYPGALAFMMGNGIASSFDFTIKPTVTMPVYAGTVLLGKPVAPNPSYETVLFYIGQAALAARDPRAIERVIIIDAQGNRNRFDFKNATQPPSIPPSEFTFTPSPGTTITRSP